MDESADSLRVTTDLELNRLFALYWMRDNGIERMDRESHTTAINRQFQVWLTSVERRVWG